MYEVTESYILNKNMLWEYRNNCATCPHYMGLQIAGQVVAAEGGQILR